jgi:regulator of protease activity HflC (stomatin/prohibitin superfamily)
VYLSIFQVHGEEEGLVVLILIIVSATTFYTVDTGERAVILRFGKLQGVASEGLNMKMPFTDAIKKMSIRDNKLSIKTEPELQTGAINYNVPPLLVSCELRNFLFSVKDKNSCET